MFECDICKKTFKSPYNLEQHIDTAHNGVIQRCNICNVIIRSAANMSQHVKAMHRTETFKCNECYYIGSTKRHLTVHIGLYHKEKNFLCKYCDFKAGYQHRINHHMKRNHGNKMTEDELKTFKIQKCPDCEYKTGAAFTMRKHMKSHDSKKLSCKLCGYVTYTKNSLKDHYSSNHSNKIVMCKQCSFISYEQHRLNSHIKRAHSGNVFDCEVCNYKTGDKNNFKLHTTTNSHKKRINGKYLRQEISSSPTMLTVPDINEYFEPKELKNEISDDEEETLTSDSKNFLELKVELKEDWSNQISDDEMEEEASKTTQNLSSGLWRSVQYLCPISSCSFSLPDNDENKKLSHLKFRHKDIDRNSINFIKL